MLLRVALNYQNKPRLRRLLGTSSATLCDSGTLVNRFTERTHTCGELSSKDVGKRVQLLGWVEDNRFDNKIITLRDSYGKTQCIMDKSILAKGLKKINKESILKVSGTVYRRPDNQINNHFKTGEVEVHSNEVHLLNTSTENPPFLPKNAPSVNLHSNLKYRYLTLRNEEMQRTLRLRSQVCKILRDRLHQLGFVECETPTLLNRTPGGANEFIVPTQTKDKFFSLVQSPQQLKQLLMIGGLDRYFQICHCYRDESTRSDRQPEFTQVDIELSFTNQMAVMKLIDELILCLINEVSLDSEDKNDLLSSFSNDQSLQIMTYSDAMNHYGTDKPDIRFECPIVLEPNGRLSVTFPSDVDTHICESIIPPKGTISVETLEDCVKVVAKDTSDESRKLLGSTRRAIAEELCRQGRSIYSRKFAFLWVIDFPLFTRDETGLLQANHHPFTAPSQETLGLLDVDACRVIGQHYDLVLNGQEIAGGSIRIHDAALQERIFTDFLKEDLSKFAYFIEALNSGCPPHGGIAIGLDRLMAILLNRDSIRDVIAFPKSSSGRDLLTDCPEELSPDVRQIYHIR